MGIRKKMIMNSTWEKVIKGIDFTEESNVFFGIYHINCQRQLLRSVL